MMAPLKATFFTLQRRDRAVLLPATLLMLALEALVIAAFVALNWNGISQFVHLIQQGPAKVADQQAVFIVASFFMLFGSAFLLLFPFYIILAAYEAACLRWMIRGETPGLFGLTLNEDTWRVYGVYWCWLLAQLTVGFVVSMLTMPLMFATMGQILTSPTPDPEAIMRWQLGVQLPLSLLQNIPLIFIGIRFGPAAATSIARGRFSFFEAWQVTKGRFVSLFGSYLVLWLIFGLGFALIFALSYGYLFQDVWRDWFAHWPTPPTEDTVRGLFARVFSAQGLAVYALSTGGNFVLIVGYALMSYGVNARAALAALAEGKIQHETAAA